jgi:hypothetical protein
MPRFTPRPDSVTFGFPIFDKGIYRVEVGEPKAFLNPGKNGKIDNHGVRLSGKIIQSDDHPEMVGKPHPIQLFQHTEGALSFSKGIQAAILNETKDSEFNEKYGNLDWGYDTDDGSCGQGWHILKGKIVNVEYGDKKFDNATGNEQSGDAKYFPFNPS